MNHRTLTIVLIILTLSTSVGIALYLTTSSGLITFQTQKIYTGDILNKFGDTNITPSDEPVDDPSNQPVLISSTVATAPLLLEDGVSARYYEQGTGRVIDTKLATGREQIVSNTSLTGFMETLWSPNHHEVLSLFQNKTRQQWRYYNYDTRQTTPLDPAITNVVFSPQGDQIAYVKYSGDQGGIYIGNPDNTIAKKIFDTRLTDLVLFWPSASTIYIVTNNTDHIGQLLSLQITGELTTVLSDVPNLETNWSPDGKKLIYSSRDTKGLNTTHLLDLTSGTDTLATLSTYASKCAWEINNTIVVCGVPLLNDNQDSTIATLIPDDFYQIDTKTNIAKVILTASRPQVVVKKIFISSLGDYLLFLNQYDNKLYSIAL